MPPVRMSEERRFLTSLKRLFDGIIEDAKNGVKYDQKARAFLESPEVDAYIRKTVTKMVRNVRVGSQESWRVAASKGSNGRLIYNAMRHEMTGPVGDKVWALIAENVAYIKTLPQEWARYASTYAATQTLRGKRPEAVEAELRKVIPQHMAKNLKCIARTECAKANAAVVQARAEMCGIKCYIWRCVRDERSRGAHMAMEGIVVFYDDPPNPEALFPVPDYIRKDGTPHYPTPYGNYHAGNTFNCRCYMEPVVDLRFLPDSFSYYKDGSVHRTTKREFIQLFGRAA